MINFYVADDPRRHVCEVQVAHHTMLVARKGLPGHQVYDHVRNAIEINEFLGVCGEQGRAARLRELRAQGDPIASTAQLLRLGCKPEALIASGCGQGELEQARYMRLLWWSALFTSSCGRSLHRTVIPAASHRTVVSYHRAGWFYCFVGCFHAAMVPLPLSPPHTRAIV